MHLKISAIAVLLISITACSSKRVTITSGLPMVHCVSDCCVLPVLLEAQEQTAWCWNATGQMAMNFLNAYPRIEQPESAKFNSGRSDCVAHPDKCNDPGWPAFLHHQFTFRKTIDEPLSLNALKEQIYIKRTPVAFSWHGSGLGGHMMLAIGHCVVQGVDLIIVNDPYPWPTGTYSQIPYNYYVTGNLNRHWDDFYDITKTP
jgi:hypothetical protein